MRKAFALFIAILIFFAGLYSAIFIKINKEKDNVTVTENIVYGDKTYAEGVTVSTTSRYGQKLQWKTEYTIGEIPLTKTDFNFYPFEIRYEDSEIRRKLSLYTIFNFSTTADDYYDNIYSGIKNAYKEMMKDAEPYVLQEKTILLSDYYDYYPLAVDVNFENLHISYPFFYRSASEYELTIIDSFNKFFRIPVIDGHMLSINAIADEDGNITQWGTSHTDESPDNFEVYLEGSITDDKCFLSFDNRTANGKTVDVSNVPGGYGIYCLPFTEADGSVQFDFDNMRNVYPVDEKNSVYEIHLSDDNSHLYVMTRENNKCVLTVIDTEAYDKKFSLEITNFEKGYSYISNVGENFILYTTYDEINDKNYFTVVSIDESREYNNEFTVPYDYIGDFAKWDGEFIYLADTVNYDDSNIQPCRFNFNVYNKDGLKFRGEYDLSLSTGFDGNFSSSYYVYIGYDKIDFELPVK